MLLTQAYSSDDLDDTAQVMKNMRMAPSSNSKEPPAASPASYNDQIKNIAEQQPEYKDEYEGFGSLTEMIKNKDKIADKAAEVVVK